MLIVTWVGRWATPRRCPTCLTPWRSFKAQLVGNPSRSKPPSSWRSSRPLKATSRIREHVPHDAISKGKALYSAPEDTTCIFPPRVPRSSHASSYLRPPGGQLRPLHWPLRRPHVFFLPRAPRRRSDASTCFLPGLLAHVAPVPVGLQQPGQNQSRLRSGLLSGPLM
eukprot:jgi/Botrbrau1/21864/Bobra.0576s0001.1